MGHEKPRSLSRSIRWKSGRVSVRPVRALSTYSSNHRHAVAPGVFAVPLDAFLAVPIAGIPRINHHRNPWGGCGFHWVAPFSVPSCRRRRRRFFYCQSMSFSSTYSSIFSSDKIGQGSGCCVVQGEQFRRSETDTLQQSVKRGGLHILYRTPLYLWVIFIGHSRQSIG